MTLSESVLPLSDRRSPFYVNVPNHDLKPIDQLVSYFKLWKHFIAGLTAYIKDLKLAKDFELNLNLQLVGSVQFPGFRSLPYNELAALELSQQSPPTSQASTPKLEKTLLATPLQGGDRPGLFKTKSASFLKNQNFAHRRSSSNVSLKSESPAPAAVAPAKSPAAPTLAPQNLAAKIMPKSDVTIDPSYFPRDSLFTNAAQALVGHHMNAYHAQVKLCREISTKMLPRLESLHKNLLLKIREIKASLKNDAFANTMLITEISKTGAIMNSFIKSVQIYTGKKPMIHGSAENVDDDDNVCLNDPFLIKMRLDYQLKNQLINENYIFAAYVNLQNISKDLHSFVVKDLNSVTERLIRAVNSENVYVSSPDQALYNLGVTLKDKLHAADHDWQHFVAHNKHLLDIYGKEGSPKKEVRSFNDVIVPFADTIHAKCLRCGYMYKKQKVIKSYTSNFYLLTCNYLHEFRTDLTSEKPHNKKKSKGKVGGVVGHDDVPVKSYNLNNYLLLVKNDKSFKFILTKVSDLSQKFTFKCLTEQDFDHWTTDLHDLLKYGSNHMARFAFIEKKMGNRHRISNGVVADDNLLNLGGLLLGQDASLNRITSQSLSGAFTPKVQLPSDSERNPFDAIQKSNAVAKAMRSPLASPSESIDSGKDSSPLEKNTLISPDVVSPSGHHEDYMKLQLDIIEQQQRLLEETLGKSSRPSLSRNSSADSIVSTIEPSGIDLSDFLLQNKDVLEVQPEMEARFLTESLIPTVTVLNADH